jgi:hypothetical protein
LSQCLSPLPTADVLTACYASSGSQVDPVLRRSGPARPAGATTSRETVETLKQETNAALANPQNEGVAADLRGTALAGSTAEFGKLMLDG